MSSSWHLGDLIDPGVLEHMGAAASDRRTPLIMQAAAALRSRLAAGSETHLIWVPGRIEIAGKHTDYAGGRSLIAPTEQGIALVAVPRRDRRICVVDARLRTSFEFSLDEEPTIPPESWQAYFVTVARRLDQNFPSLSRGADISFVSDLPAAAGLSSSSALVVGTFLALANLNALPDRIDYKEAIPDLSALAGYLGAIENGYSYGALEGTQGVGTFGGSEDHTAILCGQAGRVVQYRYSPVRFEASIRLPTDFILAVASSGLRAEKTGSARADYNRLSLQTQEIAALWRAATDSNLSDLGSILDSEREAVPKFLSLVKNIEDPAFPVDQLHVRFVHFEQENEVIVPGAAAALEAGDMGQFGDWIDRSMQLAETLLGNQVPETSFLASEARQLGAVAASAFGAGFGGAVWALVPRTDAEKFKCYLKKSYLQAFPQHAEAAAFFLTEAGPPAMEISPKS